MPTVKTVPIGVLATREFVQEVGTVTGLDVQPLLDHERAGTAQVDASRSLLPWYSRSVDSTYLTGKRVFVFGDATHVLAAARIARDELGFQVVGIGTYSREFARPVREYAASIGVEALISDDYLAVEQHQRSYHNHFSYRAAALLAAALRRDRAQRQSVPASTGAATNSGVSADWLAMSINLVPLPASFRTNRLVTGCAKLRKGHARCPARQPPTGLLLCEPGANHRQPFSSVAASRANQKPTAEGGSVYRKVESWCANTAPPTRGCYHTRCGIVRANQTASRGPVFRACRCAYLEDEHGLQQMGALEAELPCNRLDARLHGARLEHRIERMQR
jgi:hypothetical protein